MAHVQPVLDVEIVLAPIVTEHVLKNAKVKDMNGVNVQLILSVLATQLHHVQHLELLVIIIKVVI